MWQIRKMGDSSAIPGIAAIMPAAIVIATVAEPTQILTSAATRKGYKKRQEKNKKGAEQMELMSQKMRELAPELDPLRIGTGWKPEETPPSKGVALP